MARRHSGVSPYHYFAHDLDSMWKKPTHVASPVPNSSTIGHNNTPETSMNLHNQRTAHQQRRLFRNRTSAAKYNDHEELITYRSTLLSSRAFVLRLLTPATLLHSFGDALWTACFGHPISHHLQPPLQAQALGILLPISNNAT